MQNEVSLDYLLEGFIDDSLVEQCRGIVGWRPRKQK